MAIRTRVVCHTTIENKVKAAHKSTSFVEGEIYDAFCYGDNLVEIYCNTGNFYIDLNREEFFKFFTTINLAENEQEFLAILCPETEETTQLKQNINNLNLILQWQKKQSNQI